MSNVVLSGGEKIVKLLKDINTVIPSKDGEVVRIEGKVGDKIVIDENIMAELISGKYIADPSEKIKKGDS